MSKVILITGSTDGIGKLAAIKLAKEGHTIYLHGRNEAKLNRLIEAVKQDSSNKEIHGVVADFSDLRSVYKMIQNLSANLAQIDVLVNNAGIFKTANPINEMGLDVRIAVNYYAPYILTNGLLPLIKKSAHGRVINLSSAAQSPISNDLLTGINQFSDQEAYAQSKLAILMWSFYLAKNEPTLNVIALNPGSLLNTKMVMEAYGKSWSSAEKGADIIFDLALYEKYNNDSGKYFDNDIGKFGEAYPDAYNQLIVENLIAQTNTAIEKMLP